MSSATIIQATNIQIPSDNDLRFAKHVNVCSYILKKGGRKKNKRQTRIISVKKRKVTIVSCIHRIAHFASNQSAAAACNKE